MEIRPTARRFPANINDSPFICIVPEEEVVNEETNPGRSEPTMMISMATNPKVRRSRFPEVRILGSEISFDSSLRERALFH